MPERKSYNQFCGLARSLDRVGDRWTLLIIRELLLGHRTFRELESALEGISPSLLTKRLGELADDGLLLRNDAPRRSKRVEYGLTDAGLSLAPVIMELIRWGSRWMVNGPGDDRVDPRWAPLALKALLEGQPSLEGRIHVDVDGVDVTVVSASGRRRVTQGHHGDPDAAVAASLPAILSVAAGAVPLRDSEVSFSGDVSVADELLVPTAIADPD